jgi:hypothetical protein
VLGQIVLIQISFFNKRNEKYPEGQKLRRCLCSYFLLEMSLLLPRMRVNDKVFDGAGFSE